MSALSVNWVACDGHGLCASLFPERLELDVWGYPVVSAEPITRDLLPHARAAVGACPASALRLRRHV